jgi:hypothetical protein
MNVLTIRKYDMVRLSASCTLRGDQQLDGFDGNTSCMCPVLPGNPWVVVVYKNQCVCMGIAIVSVLYTVHGSVVLVFILLNHSFGTHATQNAVVDDLATCTCTVCMFCLQEEPDEHGQGKWEGKQEGKSDKRMYRMYACFV